MNEQISALTDGELAVEDVAHVVTIMQSNRQAEATWSHYHLIGDAIRGDLTNVSSYGSLDHQVYSAGLSQDFKQNLMQKLELEPTVLAPNAALADLQLTSKSHHKTPVIWSIAASFAAVMVVGWMTLHQQVQTDQELTSIEVAQNVPTEYLVAHQASAPSASSYYIQSVSYSE